MFDVLFQLPLLGDLTFGDLLPVCFVFGFIFTMIFEWPDILHRYFGEKEDEDE